MSTRGFLAPALAAAALALSPALASAQDALTLDDSTTTIAPGITLHSFQTLSASGWLKAKVLTADLTRPTLHSDMLVSNGVTASATTLSRMAGDAGAIAAINGDFFNVGDSNAPSGWEMRGDTLFKTANQSSSRNTVAGIDEDGLGRLATLTLTGNAFFSGANHRIWGVNTASPAANQINLFTPEWGDYTRNSGSWRGATPLIEVVVAGGKVVSKSATPGTGRLPAGSYALAARGATTVRNLDALNVGDPVDISFSVANDIAKKLRYAIGGATALVRNGVVPAAVHYDSPSDEVDVQGRPAVGFKDGGKTMMLVAVDGRQTDVKGLTAQAMAEFMKSLGADDALLFDGGGSTEMVARNPGDSALTVQNTPSDGAERPVPDGIALFSQPGDGTPHQLVLGPDAPRVFPGLHRTLTAKAVDDMDAPVAAPVSWTGADDGVLHAPGGASGTLTVRASAGAASADASVRVLGALRTLEVSSSKLTFPDATPAKLTVTGRDAEGYAAPVEAQDLDLSYDHDVIEVEPAAGGLTVTPLHDGATHLVLTAGDVSETVAVSVGIVREGVYSFEGANTRWVLNGTANTGQVATDTPDGLQIAYGTARNMGVTAGGVAARQVALPGQPLRVAVELETDQATTLDSIVLYDAKNTAYTIYGTPPTTSTDWQTVTFTVPAGVTFPLRLNGFQLIETDVSKQRAGAFTLRGVSVDGATPVADPPADPVRPDPRVAPGGDVPGWTFASLSGGVGAAALDRVRAGAPDFVVLDGDVSGAAPADVRATLEQGGCRLVALSSTLGTAVPAGDGTPCFYVPGEKEAAGFAAAFGQPYGTFDHKGTRFVLLDSAAGTLRTSAWDQLPLLQRALDTAAGDDSIDDVVVFAHHGLDDLTDRTEAALVAKLLAGSRKPVSIVGAHAGAAGVRRREGVANWVQPGAADASAGFTGWTRWGIQGGTLRADVHAFAQSVALDAPGTLAVGGTARLAASVVQDGRTVPLTYPLAAHWSSSGDAAVLDPATGELTAEHPGAVTVSVTEDGVVASKTVVIPASAGIPVGGDVPATLSLSLGGPASFGAFTPGAEKTYTADTTATVTSTAGDATLSVSDPGRLANGAFSLPEPLAVTLSKTAWTAPVSNDTVAVAFTQHIGANDALRTGSYTTTLTFTLATTTP